MLVITDVNYKWLSHLKNIGAITFSPENKQPSNRLVFIALFEYLSRVELEGITKRDFMLIYT